MNSWISMSEKRRGADFKNWCLWAVCVAWSHQSTKSSPTPLFQLEIAGTSYLCVCVEIKLLVMRIRLGAQNHQKYATLFAIATFATVCSTESATVRSENIIRSKSKKPANWILRAAPSHCIPKLFWEHTNFKHKYVFSQIARKAWKTFSSHDHLIFMPDLQYKTNDLSQE